MTAFVLLPHPQRREAQEVSASLVKAAFEAGLTPVVPTELRSLLGGADGVEYRPTSDVARGCDFTVAVGGDGTILHAFATLPDLPIVGVHAGELGYLATVQPGDIERFVAAAAEGRLEFDELAVLDVTHPRGRQLALNDAVISKDPDGRAPKVRVRVDGTELVTMLADALVLATPTGSTGYTFSARGPIVSQSISALVMTPVAPHTLWDRPLVLGPTSVVEVELVADRSGILLVDGNRSATLVSGDKVSVTVGERTARLLRWGSETPIARVRRLTEPAQDYDV